MQESRLTTLPPGLHPDGKVVLFDGVCKLCSAWARFLIQHDPQREFQLATVQSPEGQAILAWFGLSTSSFDTMVLVEGPRLYVRSTSFVRVMARLGWPFKLVTAVWIIPAPVRDWLYDRIALNRYRLFGRHAQCLLPTPDHEARFVGQGPASSSGRSRLACGSEEPSGSVVLPGDARQGHR